MSATKRRRHGREQESAAVPSYSDFISFASGLTAKSEEASSPTLVAHPTYSEFTSWADKELPNNIISFVPTYSEFLSYSTDVAKVKVGFLPPIPPSYSEFLSKSSESKLFAEEFSSHGEPEEPTEDEPSKKTAAEKTGLALSVSASVLAWGAVATSVVASREVEWYMFAPAVLALILAIVGERLCRRSRHQFYINTIVFSVFASVFPIILLAIGWLELR